MRTIARFGSAGKMAHDDLVSAISFRLRSSGYSVLVLRAQNDGEGGVFALYGLLHDRKDRRVRMLLWALIAGAGLLIGDGMITER